MPKSNGFKPTDSQLEDLLKLMEEENLHELEISDGASEIKLVRQSREIVIPRGVAVSSGHASGSAAPAVAPAAAPEKGTPIKSPLAGVFYRAPSPTAPVFVKEGDVVTPDKVVCIVEAMKVLNEINAGVNGKITRIMVENGKPIQNGQTLFLVEPA